MTNVTTDRQVKPANLIMYGLGDILGGGSFVIVGMLYMFFLTEVVGLSLWLAGLVFAIGKGWDAISDPLMGYLSDHTRSRFGRRRVYFLAGIIPIAITFIIMWIPLETKNQWALFAYYSMAYVLFMTIYTMVMIPYSAINAEISRDFKVRSRLSGSRLIFSGIASLIGGTVPKIIIDMFPVNPGMGYLVMSIGFGILFALPFIVVFLGTWELPPEGKNSDDSESLSIFTEFFTIMKNRSFRIHICMYVCAYTAMDVLMALFLYYLTYYLNKPQSYTIAIGSLLLTQLLMLPVYVYISNRKGMGFAYIMGLIIWFAGTALTLTFTTETSILFLSLVCVVIGFGTSAGVLIPYAILPSIIDVDELMTGKVRSGIYSGSMTLTRKLIQGVIAMPLIGFTLTAIGFVSKQQQSPEVLQNMKILFLAGPSILIFLGIIVATRFKITPKTHAILRAEIQRLKNGGEKSAVDADTKKVCETLTGIAYEKLYQKN